MWLRCCLVVVLWMSLALHTDAWFFRECRWLARNRCAGSSLPRATTLVSSGVTPDKGCYNKGNSITYRGSCRAGYVMTGSLRNACLGRSKWLNPAPVCKRRCPYIRAPLNGYMNRSDNSVGAFLEGTLVSFRCNRGYVRSGTWLRRCQANGQWTPGTTVRCTPVNCGNPGTPENGARRGSVFTYQRTVSFSCNSGYRLNPTWPTGRTCLYNGRWSGRQPTCERTCGDPGTPENGWQRHDGFAREFWVEDEYGVGRIVRFGCNRGYTLQDNSSRRCLANGQWSGSQPTCRPDA